MKSYDPWNTIVTDEFGDIVWPRPYYGHSFYQEVPSWIHYGDNGTRRTLFDGAFIGAEAPSVWAADSLPTLEVASMMQPYTYAGHRMSAEGLPPIVPGNLEPRRGLLAEVAPHVAPATGPISVKKDFDDRQVLHVEICVDGKCYRTSMNLAPALSMVMERLAQWHKDQHAASGPIPAPTAIVGAVDNAIDAAGDAMADTLVCHHVRVMTGGFFDDIGSAIGGTLRKLEPVISTVATGVATYYGGPEAGAAAGKLAPVVTSLHANLLDPKGSPDQKAAAQQGLQRVNQIAQIDPRAAQALAAAHQAVKDTAIAYHVKGAVDRAVAGDPAARRDVSAVVQAADRGDPAAKSTYEVIAQTLLNKAQQSAWGQQLWDKIMGGGGQDSSATVSAGWYSSPVVGSFWDDVGNAVLTVTGTKATNQFIHDHGLEPYVNFAAKAVATYYGGPAGGAAAGVLTPMVTNLGVDDKSKAAAAQQNVQGVTAMAEQHSPEMAQAVNVAKGSIKAVSTAYHINHLLKLAKGGDAQAQRALRRLQALAASGNQDAQKALQAVNIIHQGQVQSPSSGLVPGPPPPAVRGWYDLVGPCFR